MREILTIEETLTLGLALLPEQAWALAYRTRHQLNTPAERELILNRLAQIDPIVAQLVREFYLKLKIIDHHRLNTEAEFKQRYVALVRQYRASNY